VEPLIRRAVAWLRLLALAPLGRWGELEETLATLAGEEQRLIGTPAGHAYFTFSARLAAHRGDADRVLDQVEAARRSMGGGGLEMDQIGNLCELALACDEVGLTQRARELAREAVSTGRSLAMPWQFARAALVAAHCEGAGEA